MTSRTDDLSLRRGLLLACAALLASYVGNVGATPPTRCNAHESVESFDQLARLREINRQLNITRTVLIGHYAETFVEGTPWKPDVFDLPNNRFVLEAARRYPDEFVPLVIVDPNDPDWRTRLDDYVERGAVGVQVYAKRFEDGLDDPRYDAFFQHLETRDIALYLRVALQRGSIRRTVERRLNKHPYLRVLIPHFMVGENKPDVIRYLLQKHPNLHFDVSYGFRSWRSKHLTRVSENIAALREIVRAFPDRVLFGTDVIVSAESWKDDAYLVAAYSDFIHLLEQEQFTFSVTKETLNGFALPEDVLRQVYHENFERFFRPTPRPPFETRYDIGLPSNSDAVPHPVLLALVGNWFGPFHDVACTRDTLALPSTAGAFFVDARLEGRISPTIPSATYRSANNVLRAVRADRQALGLVALGDIDSTVRLLRVNGRSLLDRRLRVDSARLRSYPLIVAADGTPTGATGAPTAFSAYDYVSVLTTGGSLPGQGLLKQPPTGTYQDWLHTIRPVLRDADVTHLSLETAFVPDGVNDLKKFKFCTPATLFDILPYLGIDIVGLSGNHLTDFGRSHLDETLKRFRRVGISYYGGGRSDTFGECSETLDLFGTRLGFTGYNDVSGRRGLAAPKLSGSLELELARIEKDLRRLSASHDAVIVDVQAGSEFGDAPSYYQRTIASHMNAWGATIVQYVHPHVLKGVDWLPSSFCAYGLGNFLFAHPSRVHDTHNALAFKYYFHRGRLVQIEPIALRIDGNHIEPGDRSRLDAHLARLFEQRNRRSAAHLIRAVTYAPKHLKKRHRARIARRFNVVPVAADPAGNTPTAPKFLAAYGDGESGHDPATPMIFAVDSREELSALRELLLHDRERLRSFFIENADRIVFGGTLFKRHACKSYGCNHYFGYQLMTLYRDVLEQSAFAWPDLDAHGGEWAYDHKKDTWVPGLDLPDDVLRKIYDTNAHTHMGTSSATSGGDND